MTAFQNAGPSITRLAPAKINLALHVTGRRDDGYHLLDMLVVFADHGDRIHIERANSDSFTVSGPFASGIPAGRGNLVLKARDALRQHGGPDLSPVAIHLEKNLPIASGIGGGSSDAAATLLALNTLWQLDLDFGMLAAIGLSLGADLPMCLHGAAHGTPLIARGIGEELSDVSGIAALPMLLVNDGTALATPDVFRALTRRENAPLPLPACEGTDALCAYLRETRNDLLPAAISLAPQIELKLALLRAKGALHAQMSGSGATCFAIFSDESALTRAAKEIADENPGWFAVPSHSFPSRA
ncbi:4-(cytidine 5'-diphospho)-2-C-methyl-D-erythritol kinase [Brucella sp. 10RB9213]|uniref:4-(cytidine 5'-diphospho)-2-C-methyl-D-erythritol kinase n=1 Tax=Brucella sp. 10RB9213 TaxID=1844039 RepID=UPI0012AD3619|nr:4-(cytidine 5'-diphospho)-2-C-methyl-D-erythritol kinase [Brucella sp. 10RB9213]MRN67886.1 4-(cytidine 5'-diphospho)-2-C-methyl-D-erythritol kinase [Brucella sp. 10RB9213]